MGFPKGKKKTTGPGTFIYYAIETGERQTIVQIVVGTVSETFLKTNKTATFFSHKNLAKY